MGFNRNQSPLYPLSAQSIQSQSKGGLPVSLASVGWRDIVAEMAAMIEECLIDAGENPHQADYEASIIDDPIIHLSEEIIR